MKSVLIQPPVQDFYDTDLRLQPIGLCYLKGAIKKYPPEVEVMITEYIACQNGKHIIVGNFLNSREGANSGRIPRLIC